MPDSCKNSRNLHFATEISLVSSSVVIEKFDEFLLLLSHLLDIMSELSRFLFRTVDSAKGEPKSTSLSHFDEVRHENLRLRDSSFFSSLLRGLFKKISSSDDLF